MKVVVKLFNCENASHISTDQMLRKRNAFKIVVLHCVSIWELMENVSLVNQVHINKRKET